MVAVVLAFSMWQYFVFTRLKPRIDRSSEHIELFEIENKHQTNATVANLIHDKGQLHSLGLVMHCHASHRCARIIAKVLVKG